jgi:Do/DeqQ family serine protease
LIRLALAVVALLGAPAFADTVQRTAPQSPAQVRLSFAPVVKKAAPAVVNVYASRVETMPRNPLFDDPIFRRFFGGQGSEDQRVQKTLGSGVIVDPSGLVVTNYHVIEGMTEVKVALSDKREFEAQIVLRDPRTDLAVLRLKGGGNFPVLELGDSDALEVGDFVIAIGDPFAVGQTVTQGIVSALARTQVGISDYGFFIQTDAAINPGNSGGALVDLDGKLVGINSAIYSRTGGSMGIGFAIPVNMVRGVLSDIIANGRVVRGWIGIVPVDLPEEQARSIGLNQPAVLIENLYVGSPAQQAGLQPGDLLLALDGAAPTSAQDALGRIAAHKPGAAIVLRMLRGGRVLEMRAQVGERPRSS